MAADAPPRSPGPPQRWANSLQAAWLRRTPLALALWPLSCLYRLAWGLRSLMYRLGLKSSTRLQVPVVVVGNVVVGGAGKTPTVIEVVRHLQAAGWRPGVISRGHGRRGNSAQAVMPNSLPADVGDEPTLIAQRTAVPVVVARCRVAAARALLAQHPQVNLLVSDDGMQHWALQRDVTVVVFDARGIGNGWLLPAGLLRQPWPARPWGKGPLLVLQTGPATSAHSAWPTFSAQRSLCAVAVNPCGERRPLAAFKGNANLGALAGIARPDAFFRMLEQQELPIRHTLPLPDHADAPTLLAVLVRQPADSLWLCTEKDAVKLFPALDELATPPVEVWAVALEQRSEPAFFAALDAALPHPPSAVPVSASKALSCGHGSQTS